MKAEATSKMVKLNGGGPAPDEVYNGIAAVAIRYLQKTAVYAPGGGVACFWVI